MTAHTDLNEETVDAVARSLHRHHDRRRLGPWPGRWRKYDDLDTSCRDEYRDRAGEIITAVQGTETTDEAADTLARLYVHRGPALTKYTAYFHDRITETLSDVPTLKDTKRTGRHRAEDANDDREDF